MRWAAMVLTLLNAVLFTAFPALPASAADKPVVIKLWDHHIHDKKFRQQIFKKFNADNPDIKVEYTSQVGATLGTVLDAAYRVGELPDLFIPIGIGIPKAVELGWIMPIDDVAPSKAELQKWMDRFPKAFQPFAETINVFSGKVYSWPIGADAGRMMLFWNTKLFREAGLAGAAGAAAVPDTWENLRQYAKKITELGQGKIYGIVHGIKDPGIWDQDLFFSLANAAGHPLAGFDYRTGSFDYHHPGFRGGLQLWLDMRKDGSVFPGELSMDDEQAKFKFGQDLAGMIFGGPWVPGGLLAVNENLEFDTILPPRPRLDMKRGGINIAEQARNSDYVVSSKTKSRSVVWKVIQFMTSQEYQEGWVKAGGGYSVFPEFNKTEFFPHPTVAKIVGMLAEGRRVVPQLSPAAAAIQNVVTPGRPLREDVVQGVYIGVLDWIAFDDLERRYMKALDELIAESVKNGNKVSRSDFTFPDWDPTENYPPPRKK